MCIIKYAVLQRLLLVVPKHMPLVCSEHTTTNTPTFDRAAILSSRGCDGNNSSSDSIVCPGGTSTSLYASSEVDYPPFRFLEVGWWQPQKSFPFGPSDEGHKSRDAANSDL
eukprot:GHVS01025456.1.p1 GENE.GHVS01025456.1~~GHVS01025456.1.p1  ORF type:complete len:111 (-),score=17.74 GHVS01025456.1:632-964(-)